ncbi:hypothetical protein ACFPN2_05425 [Steroidobacter flavus]|uniref:Uncharacterized protein n=1 Tax=Steroidobacter flavus TaxID=1842136 RepID=A0ABV8SNU1_9GAMM
MVKEERSAISGLGPTVLSLLMVAAGLATPSIVGEFHRLFLGFGAELPWLTRAVLSFRIPVFVILLLCLIAQVVSLLALLNRRTPEARRLFYRIAKANLGIFVLLIVAMYVPMIKLGSPV